MIGDKRKDKRDKKISIRLLECEFYFGLPTQQCNKLVIKPVRYVPIHYEIELKQWNCVRSAQKTFSQGRGQKCSYQFFLAKSCTCCGGLLLQYLLIM